MPTLRPRISVQSFPYVENLNLIFTINLATITASMAKVHVRGKDVNVDVDGR